jgi:hypothetical protein
MGGISFDAGHSAGTRSFSLLTGEQGCANFSVAETAIATALRRGPTAPWLFPNQRTVVDLWQVQSMQGNHRAAAQGSNEGELVSQIHMALQHARPIGSIKKLRYPLKNRGWFLGHLELPLRAARGTGSASTPEHCAAARPFSLLPGEQGWAVLSTGGHTFWHGPSLPSYHGAGSARRAMRQQHCRPTARRILLASGEV